MLKKLFISMILFSVLVSCSINQDIYLDGMPISNFEYTAETPSGLKTSFILARYYEKKFDDEYMIYPEYLDLFDQNKIAIDKTKQLVLHVKIVNIKRQPIIVWYKFDNDSEKTYTILYNGRLPRKDISIILPTNKEGKNIFDVSFNSEGEELFRIWGEYENERGDS
jgi:hypothetical protein